MENWTWTQQKSGKSSQIDESRHCDTFANMHSVMRLRVREKTSRHKKSERLFRLDGSHYGANMRTDMLFTVREKTWRHNQKVRDFHESMSVRKLSPDVYLLRWGVSPNRKSSQLVTLRLRWGVSPEGSSLQQSNLSTW